jgi:hypothetical protein
LAYLWIFREEVDGRVSSEGNAWNTTDLLTIPTLFAILLMRFRMRKLVDEETEMRRMLRRSANSTELEEEMDETLNQEMSRQPNDGFANTMTGKNHGK